MRQSTKEGKVKFVLLQSVWFCRLWNRRYSNWKKGGWGRRQRGDGKLFCSTEIQIYKYRNTDIRNTNFAKFQRFKIFCKQTKYEKKRNTKKGFCGWRGDEGELGNSSVLQLAIKRLWIYKLHMKCFQLKCDQKTELQVTVHEMQSIDMKCFLFHLLSFIIYLFDNIWF